METGSSLAARAWIREMQNAILAPLRRIPFEQIEAEGAREEAW